MGPARGLGRWDLTLLLLLGPLWLLAVVLHVPRAAEGRIGWVPLVVAPEAGEAPRLQELLAQYDASATTLRAGDRILAVGNDDLRGVGRFEFTARVWAAVEDDLSFRVRARRGERSFEEQVPLQRVPQPVRTLPLIFAFGGGGLLVLWRGRGSSIARAFFVAGMLQSLMWATFFGPVAWQSRLSLGVALAATTLVLPASLRALALVAGHAAAERPLGPVWVWAFLALGPATSSWLLGWPASSSDGLVAILVANLALVALALFVLTRGYLTARPPVRRKIKWVVLGFYMGLAPVLVGAAAAAIDPSLVWVHETGAAFTVFIPICCLIAVVRDDFLDIDRLLTETTAYGAVGIVLLGLLMQVLPELSRSVAAVAGVDRGQAQTLLFSAGVAAAVPLRRVLRPRLEAFFFRERHQLEHALAVLRTELAELRDPGKIFEALGRGLRDGVEAEGCSIYVRSGDVFGAVIASGSAAPPAFHHGGLIERLSLQDGPATPLDWRRWVVRRELAPEASAALETLAPELILSVRGRREPLAFVALGPRRSGEIYGAPEIAWLDAVAESASAALRGASDAQIIERGDELRERLRRYVPGVVAERIERGGEIAPGEREVTILFVDVRGYTSYAEGRRAGEIFETLSRYTEVASEIVVRHGGSVVEFQGDGLMAVFGAPGDLAHKERAAVVAACELATAIPAIPIEGVTLEVGVGVASGPGYVGNIRAVDRLIWVAIGNTTNLAARIQSMSRDLDASVVIDGATHDAAGEAAAHFDDQGALEVRGRSGPIRVFSLPREKGEDPHKKISGE